MNNAEFESLVSQHYESIYRFALSLTGREEDACDLTKQTFARWTQHGFRLCDQSKSKSWLFTTLCMEFLGSNRQDLQFTHVEIESVEPELPSFAPSTAFEMDGRTVMEALWQLDDATRVLLSLFYIQRYSYLEIAALLKVPVGSVISRLSQGKAKLRASLWPTSQKRESSDV